MSEAGNMTDVSDSVRNLSQMFEKAVKIAEELETTDLPSSSDEFQDMVSRGIKLLEEATNMVSEIGVFSSNETLEEVATSDIRFLLLPALLASFGQKRKYSGPEKRLEQLRLAELYYKDFLRRCKSYEVPNVIIPELDDDDEGEQTNKATEKSGRKQNSARDITEMAAKRNAVINRYQAMKEADKRLTELKKSLDADETKREYYLLLLKKWVMMATDELNSIKVEKTIVASMLKMPRGSRADEKKPKPKPLKPVIIVKTELQKKVYGLGYPSVPAMTVDEFYKQRYPDGEGKTNASLKSLQEMASDPEAAKRRQEAEDIEQEQAVERDDPIALQKARAFDDWKDEHRRGSGNMKNKG